VIAHFAASDEEQLSAVERVSPSVGLDMRHFAMAVLGSILLVLFACGSGSTNNVNGNWSATLTNTDGTAAFSFTTTLNESNGNTITGTNLTFTTATPCFVSISSETGGFMLSGNTSGVTAGNFEYTVQSSNPSGNVLTMTGTLNNNTITGSWTLTGVTSGCSGSGNFTMTRS